jgi:pimeloyl-ACP methyl ester carboxylesterase
VNATKEARLHHEVAGAGPPVVLIHEGICDSRMWDPQWESFQRSHRVVRLDLRGFGRSPYVPGTFSHPADVIALLDELELGPAALVGVSLGGGVALQVAVARPDLVSALVLVGSGIRGHDWSEEITRAWEEEEAAFERRDFDAAVEVNLRTWVDGPHRSPDEVDPEVRRKVGEMQRRALELYADGGAAAEEEALVVDIGDRLGEISVPTLVLVGDLDVPDMQTIAARLLREIPDARGATIAGAAHAPTMERPDEFGELVLGFLDEAGQGA